MSRIHPLTSLRFIAALMVVAHHYFDFAPGYAGVGFFFVLSGYVLALNYKGKVDSPEERKIFWFKRFARIYPTYALTFILCLPLGPLLDHLPSVVLAQSWVPPQGFHFVGNAPSWSISDEAFFYAVFPLLLGIRGRTLALWGVGLLALALWWPFVDPVFVHGLEIKPAHFMFYVFPPTRLFEFAIGVWLASLRGRPSLRHEIGALALAGGSLVALPHFSEPIRAALAFIPASVALVYVFARSEGPIAELLSNRWLVLLGDASFALYMIHWPLAKYLGASVTVAALAVGLSVVLFLWFEKPVQKWLLSRAAARHWPRLRHESL